MAGLRLQVAGIQRNGRPSARYELVPAASDGDEVARTVWIVLDLLPEATDVHVQRPAGLRTVGAPDSPDHEPELGQERASRRQQPGVARSLPWTAGCCARGPWPRQNQDGGAEGDPHDLSQIPCRQ